MKVLLAEDTRSNQLLIKAYIEHFGHEVIAVDDGQAAIDAVNIEKPDLILMDVNMPAKNGIEATREIRAQFEHNNDWIPIVFLSGLTEAEDILKGIEAGGDDYLTKPIDPIVLHAKIIAMERIANMRHELDKVNRELKLASVKDGLTGLSNRRHFDEVLRKEFRRAARTGTSLSLIMCDIDFFKQYNDNYGHLMGDNCLKSVAHALESACKRPGDLVARYGGEEFAIILSEMDLTKAAEMAEMIRKVVIDLAIPHEQSSASDSVSLSLGIASVQPEKSMDIEASLSRLIDQADKCLYQAKEQGRNRVVTA